MLINDLQETIADNLNQRIKDRLFKYNKEPIFIKYLDKDDQICFVPNPGSHMIEEDYGGLQLWQYNYTFTVKTQRRGEAKNKLFELSEYLQSIDNLKSETGAWEFDHIEIPSAPAEIMENLKGTATYNMDVAVFVYQQRRNKKW